MPIDLSIFLRLEEKDHSLTEICAKGMASPISDEDIKDLVSAAKDSSYLKSLILWDGDITSLGAKLIADNLQFLEKIDLSGNKIDYVGLVALCGMPNLKQLTLIGNNLSQVDLSVLHSSNDDLKIILSNSTNGKNIEPIIFTPITKKRKVAPSNASTILSDIGFLYSKLLQEIDPNATKEEKENFILETQEQLRITMKNISTQLKSPSSLSKPHLSK